MEHFRIWTVTTVIIMYLLCGLALKTKISRKVFPLHPKFADFISNTLIIISITGLGCILAYVRYVQ